tara:strand:+ start:879 stop:1040 length:162 start_codon:yes stop_codon:yes gene_type:complete
MKITIYTPNKEFVIEKYIKEVKEQSEKIKYNQIIKNYENMIKDKELPNFLIDY